jgi:small-conductance mechanosensitive channel
MYLSRLPFRIVLAACLFHGGAAIASGQQPTDPPSSTATSPSTANAKPKKVWTNDDVAAASATAPVTAKTVTSPANAATEGSAQLASQLRGKLEKLQGQLKDADKQLDELKRFQAGDLSGDAGRQLHKRYSSAPIPEQIAKLEEKRNHLQDQIEAIYEEARKKGILPGQLR